MYCFCMKTNNAKYITTNVSHVTTEILQQWLHKGYIYPHRRDLGWGLLSQFPPFRYFPNFSSLSKHTLTVEYRIYIWQVSPQLSCGDTCQIWMWFEESNMYFCETENFAYGEINERSFSNPHPWPEAFPAIADEITPLHIRYIQMTPRQSLLSSLLHLPNIH